MIKANIKKEIDCDIEKIWNVITDNTSYTWRSDIKKITIVDENNFIEYTKKDYPTYFTITKKEKYSKYQFTIKNSNINGQWTGLLKQLNNGNTLLDFTEEIETNNFIMKLLAKSYLKKQQQKYMNDLETKLNSDKKEKI